VARKSSSSAVQEELYPLPRDASDHEAHEREPFDDARLVDLEAEQESPFLRGQKRVPVRRGSLPKRTAIRLKWVLLALVVFAIIGAAGAGLYDYGKHSWRFRIDSSDQIEVAGAEHVAHAQIMEVMGGDIGRNIFFVPLAQRKQQLEQISWVESASVMRFVPNRVRIEIHERTPVAFARIGSHISLIDAGGALMELAPGGKRKYSFAVITGMNAGEPLSTRAARMKNYNELVRELDAGGAHYSQELSEVDLGDPEDVKVLAADANGEVLVHLGAGSYLQRYKTYVTHVQQWRQQFEKLESVDLRYDGQIIVNPDLNGIARQPVLTATAAKAAMAAGVKTAAIVNYEKYATHPAAAAPAKKDAKLKAKAGTKAAVHGAAVHRLPIKRAVVKTALVKPVSVKPASPKPASPKPAVVKSSPANQIVLKPSANAVPVVAAKNSAAPHPAATAPPAATGQKKPSAGIPKEAPQN
jgi:cell division protein FtsQ